MKNIEEFKENIPLSAIAKIPGKADDDAYFIDFCLDENAILVTNDKLRDHDFKNLLMASAKQQGKSEDEVNQAITNEKISKFARLDEVKKIAEKLDIEINPNLPDVKKFREWSKNYRCEYTFVLGKFRPSPDFHSPSESTTTPVSSESSTPQPSTSSLSNHTVSELKIIANERGLTGYSKLKKAELIYLLETQSEPKAESNISLENQPPIPVEEFLRMKLQEDWIHLSQLSASLVNYFDGANARTIIRENTGHSGAFRNQLIDIFGAELEIRGEGGGYHARIKSKVELWLENKLVDWTPLSILGNELIANFEGSNARVIIRESTGTTGQTIRKQLESLFGNRLETRGEGGGAKIRLITTQVTESGISKEAAESHVLDLFAIDPKDRFEGRNRNTLISFIKRAIRPLYNTNHRSRKWATLKFDFKERTNMDLENIFSSPTDLCDYIESRHECLFAKYKSDFMTIIVTSR